ncbi:MAG: oligosaccharide flippase family protein [Candidatus Azambacteria bacterium]|nr:oligosaccharide flippase family protein [Candidatus Azambacteria bacterium]
MEIRGKIIQWLNRASDFLGTNLFYTLKGGSVLTLNNFISAAINLTLAIFFARLLPKEVYGTYSYVLAWISVLGIFALPGMDTAVIQSVARGFESSLALGLKKKIRYGTLGTLAALIIGGYYLYGGNQTLAAIFFISAVFIPLLNSFQIYNAYLVGKKEFKTSAFYGIMSQIFTASVLIVAIYLTDNIVYIVSAYIFATVLPNFVFFIKIKIKTAKAASPNDPGIVAYAKHLSLINVISMVTPYIDQFLAFHFLGAANLATYAFATAPPEQIKGLFKGIPDLALPKFSERSEEELKKTMTRKIVIYSVFVALVVGVYITLAPLFYKIVFPQYIDAVFLSQIFALSLLSAQPTLIMGALSAHKKIKKLYLFNIISPLFQILAMAILTPLYGLMGLVVARVIGRTFNSLFAIGIYYRR